MPRIRFLTDVGGLTAEGVPFFYNAGDEADVDRKVARAWADGTRAEFVRVEATETTATR